MSSRTLTITTIAFLMSALFLGCLILALMLNRERVYHEMQQQKYMMQQQQHFFVRPRMPRAQR